MITEVTFCHSTATKAAAENDILAERVKAKLTNGAATCASRCSMN